MNFAREPTCNEQRVHAWRRLRRLEHLADVLLWEGGLSPALPLGVLLLPPLEVLRGDSEGAEWRERGEEIGEERIGGEKEERRG